MQDVVSQKTIGPLRKDQLFIHGITAGTPIKTSGMSNFMKAYLIPDLQLLFSKEERAIAAGSPQKTSLMNSIYKVFAFLLDCLVYLAKAVGFIAILPCLPIYYACYAISSNATVTLISTILCILFIVCLIPVSSLPYMAGFIILVFLIYLLCKLLDSNDTVAALTLFGVLPIPNPIHILNSIVAFVAEWVLSYILPEKKEAAGSIAYTILFVFVSLVLLPFIGPAIFFYQCARDRV